MTRALTVRQRGESSFIDFSVTYWYISAIIQIPKINNQITAPQLLVIDEHEQNLGVLPRAEALRQAQEKGLDLIEISGHATPPVARIMSFDKYRYQQGKKLKKEKSAQKNQGIKQVQISARAAKNDLEIKAKRVNEFLGEGNLVEIVLVLRGREKANRDWAMEKLKEFMKLIVADHKIIMSPRFGGRGINMQIGRA